MNDAVAPRLLPCLLDARRRPVAEQLVLGQLARLRHGRLRIELPDGRGCTLGDVASSTPAALLRVHEPRFFRRCLWQGDIGFAESYIAGEWDTEDLVAVFRWFLANRDDVPGLSGSRRGRAVLNLLGFVNRLRHRLRPNSLRLSRRNIREHYDLSNDFFALFLDPGMTYSAAWWPEGRADLNVPERIDIPVDA